MSDLVLKPASFLAAPVAAVLLLAVLCAVSHAQAPALPTSQPVAGAETYYRWLTGCLDSLDKDLPAITSSAEAAAKAYLQGGWEIGAWGDSGIVGEFNSRAGGLIRTSQPKAIEEPNWTGIVLFFPREDSRAADFAKAAEFRKQGKLLVGFFDAADMKTASSMAVGWTGIIRTHAAPQGGLFSITGGATVVPTDPVANIATLWTWTGEFVAALTREGKMPAMHQSIMVPGALQRLDKLKDLKFEANAPQKVAPGTLGHEYIAEVRKALSAVHEQEMARIAQVAEQAADTLKAGRKAHVFAHGHALGLHVEAPHDAGFFHLVNRGLFSLKPDPQISKGDFVFCVGYDRVFEGWYFHDATSRMRAAGATLAWSMTDYNNQLDANIGPSSLPKGEVVIGQHWALGDAVVAVAGYDVKILPPSGVIGEAILQMTEAQVLAILGGDAPAKYRWTAPASAPAAKP
jgi:hypothetical protein